MVEIIRCERCNEKLNPDKAVWLELSMSTGLYTDPKNIEIPQEDSQGGFAFGSKCACAVLKNGGELIRINK